MSKQISDETLSKELAFALRHAPEKYGVEPDEDGFVSIDDLLRAFNVQEKYGREITSDDLTRITAEDPKHRYEIKGDMIRARYGHSFALRIRNPRVIPPDVLYHGTSRRVLNSILTEGLKPMQRQYVHLSGDLQTALLTGKRHDTHPVVLRIDAAAAVRNGLAFYQGSENIYLTDYVPAKYLMIEEIK